MLRFLAIAAFVIVVGTVIGLCGRAVLNVDNEPAARPSDWRK